MQPLKVSCAVRRIHVYMNFFDHKNLGNHLLQLGPKVVKHPVYIYYIYYREVFIRGPSFAVVTVLVRYRVCMSKSSHSTAAIMVSSLPGVRTVLGRLSFTTDAIATLHVSRRSLCSLQNALSAGC